MRFLIGALADYRGQMESEGMCKKLLNVLDLDRDGSIGVSDWVICAERVTHASYREHFTLFRRFLEPAANSPSASPPGGLRRGALSSSGEGTLSSSPRSTNGHGLRRAPSSGMSKVHDMVPLTPLAVADIRTLLLPLCRRSDGTLIPDLEQQLNVVAQASSVEWLLFTLGTSSIFQAFSNMLMTIFTPTLQEMSRKLKNRGALTVHSVSFGESWEVPSAVHILCDAMARAHAVNARSHDFSLSTMRDQKPMVEAITYGVRYNANADEWALVGVPLLLLSVRVYLRSFLEAVFTQYLSAHILMKALNQDTRARVELLKECYRWLPRFHRNTLQCIMNCVTAISSTPSWVRNVTTCLASVVFNSKPCDHATPALVDEMFELLFLNWQAIKATSD